MKKWDILPQIPKSFSNPEEILQQLLQNRGLANSKDANIFLRPPAAFDLKAADVGIDTKALNLAVKRIRKAITAKESIVVYADYDADGITAGAIMWETLYAMGARVMPYIPHRVEEGYGLSIKGIDNVRAQYDPTLVITVDHGITAWEKVEYAKSLGMDVIVTDHHTKPEKVPDAITVHTTQLAGSGVSWFLAKEVSGIRNEELTALATIGTVADLVPLIGPNRAIVKEGLTALNRTSRVGLLAMLTDAGLSRGALSTYSISHVLAPRLNAMGRIVHAMDALRLLCTKQEDKAMILARQLGLTNKERQRLTEDASLRAKESLYALGNTSNSKKLLFLAHTEYNQGIIGLVAGRLVEEYYRPAIVVAIGEDISKASARSISGFNIVEAIKSCSDLLIDVGGHPMAAGFTVETKNLTTLQQRLEQVAEEQLDQELLTRRLRIDAEIPLGLVSETLCSMLEQMEPFGFGNPEPVFVSGQVQLRDVQLLGSEGKHLKIRVRQGEGPLFQAVAFSMGDLYPKLFPNMVFDVAYTVEMNEWNGKKRLQLKIKDIHFE